MYRIIYTILRVAIPVVLSTITIIIVSKKKTVVKSEIVKSRTSKTITLIIAVAISLFLLVGLFFIPLEHMGPAFQTIEEASKFNGSSENIYVMENDYSAMVFDELDSSMLASAFIKTSAGWTLSTNPYIRTNHYNDIENKVSYFVVVYVPTWSDYCYIIATKTSKNQKPEKIEANIKDSFGTVFTVFYEKANRSEQKVKYSASITKGTKDYSITMDEHTFKFNW